MRWFDMYIGLLAVTMGFGAVVGWRAGMPPGALAVVLIVGAVLGTVVAWRAVRTPRVLVVGYPDPEFDLRESLDEAGYAVRVCVGPARRPCPVLEGGECPIPGQPVAAIVRIPAGYAGPDAPCGRALGIRMIEVREATAESPGAGEATPIERPEAIVAAMERALAG